MPAKTPAAYQATLRKLRKAASKSGGTRQSKERAKKALQAHTRSRSSYYGSNPSNRAVRKVAKAGRKLVKAVAGTPGRVLGAASKSGSKGAQRAKSGAKKVAASNRASAVSSGRSRKNKAINDLEKQLRGSVPRAKRKKIEAELRRTRNFPLSIFKKAVKPTPTRGDMSTPTSRKITKVRSAGLAAGRAASSAASPPPPKKTKKKAAKKKTKKKWSVTQSSYPTRKP